MSSFSNQNKPNPALKNRPIDELVHRYKARKWISNQELEDLALNKYQVNGKGLTYLDLINTYNCSKKKAQRKLKNACREKINNKRKFSTLFRLDNERTNPQQYYPSCIKAK